MTCLCIYTVAKPPPNRITSNSLTHSIQCPYKLLFCRIIHTDLHSTSHLPIQRFLLTRTSAVKTGVLSTLTTAPATCWVLINNFPRDISFAAAHSIYSCTQMDMYISIIHIFGLTRMSYGVVTVKEITIKKWRIVAK